MHYIALLMASKALSMVPKIQEKHEVICKGCAQGKNAKKKFLSSESKAKGILEKVHSNACMPFIDDFSRKTWINFLKGKIEVFGNTKPWSRTTPKGRSRLYGQTMAENLPQKNSRNSAESMGLRTI